VSTSSRTIPYDEDRSAHDRTDRDSAWERSNDAPSLVGRRLGPYHVVRRIGAVSGGTPGRGERWLCIASTHTQASPEVPHGRSETVLVREKDGVIPLTRACRQRRTDSVPATDRSGIAPMKCHLRRAALSADVYFTDTAK